MDRNAGKSRPRLAGSIQPPRPRPPPRTSRPGFHHRLSRRRHPPARWRGWSRSPGVPSARRRRRRRWLPVAPSSRRSGWLAGQTWCRIRAFSAASAAASCAVATCGAAARSAATARPDAAIACAPARLPLPARDRDLTRPLLEAPAAAARVAGPGPASARALRLRPLEPPARWAPDHHSRRKPKARARRWRPRRCRRLAGRGGGPGRPGACPAVLDSANVRSAHSKKLT